ncbi:MAG: serine hydrolase domain-containing protein [Wenzhouxiangellaceae bacterium]|nr:serine hydrolase domain-containing protein [Wenzhouxiangellaceae bacterium]
MNLANFVDDRCLIAALALLACSIAGAQQVEPGDAAGQGTAEAETATPAGPVATDFLDGAVQALMRHENLPGLTLSVVRDGETLARGYGLADASSGRPVDADETLFRIGSISKTFVWTAAMMLADRGQLDLDADVNRYLQDVEIEPAFDAPVTMNHLMAHTAGFEDTMRVFQPTDDDPRTLAEVLAATQPARVYPPGARTSYSNWGAALAAQVVADVAGVPYETFLSDEILAPLGMISTTLVPPARMDDAVRARLATGQDWKAGEHVRGEAMQIGPFAPAGGMSSTATDMARWMRFHLNEGALDGVRLMSADAHREMFSRAVDDRPAAPGVAHGFQDRTWHGVRLVLHGGSTGRFLSTLVLAPELDLGVFVSQNSGQAGYKVVGGLPLLIVERLAGPPAAEGRFADGDASSLQEYAGGYVANRRPFTTQMALYWARTSVSVAPHPDGGLLVAHGGETYRFRPVPGEPDVFENRRGERIAFRRDDAGEIVALTDVSGVHSHERLTGLGDPRALYASVGLVALLAVTTLLGFWRRWRQRPETTRAGKRAATAAVVSAVIVLVFFAAGIAALAVASSMTGADLADYPPAGVVAFSWAGWAVAAAAVLALFALVPAWRDSGWGAWRRLHFTLFALALAFFAFQLWQWKLFGAPYI